MSFNSDLTPAEITALLQCAHECATEMKYPEYIEIGVFEGGTMKRVIETGAFHKYTGIDLFEDWYKDTEKNTHVSGTVSLAELQQALPAARLLKGDSARILPTLNLMSGMIFIDGNHKFLPTLADLLLSMRIMDHGYILLHNVTNDQYPDVEYYRADGGPFDVVEIAKSFGTLNYITTVDRLAIFEKFNP